MFLTSILVFSDYVTGFECFGFVPHQKGFSPPQLGFSQPQNGFSAQSFSTSTWDSPMMLWFLQYLYGIFHHQHVYFQLRHRFSDCELLLLRNMSFWSRKHGQLMNRLQVNYSTRTNRSLYVAFPFVSNHVAQNEKNIGSVLSRRGVSVVHSNQICTRT